MDPAARDSTEASYPLHARVCESCYLVQVDDVVTPEAIFNDYAYFSSYSESWLSHAKAFAEETVKRRGLGSQSLVLEVASNDGYLLREFAALGIPTLGVEPAANVAEVSTSLGIETIVEFFGSDLARSLAADGRLADVVAANNVVAHVPDLNDFVEGLRLVLKPEGVVSIEVPHLLRLLEQVAFDTIYHEHFSYFSFSTLKMVLARHGLAAFDVEEPASHGGSLRVWAAHESAGALVRERVQAMEQLEGRAGLATAKPYQEFTTRVERCRDDFLSFLASSRSSGRSVVAYGAAAKGNTFLNYCEVTVEQLDYVVDRSPHKQGMLLPGSRLPIFAPSHVEETEPDYLLILPWNLRREISAQMSSIARWGGRFVTAIPSVEVFG